MKRFIELQEHIIWKFKVNICNGDNCKCWGRMHAHVKERKVCKWYPKNSAHATFELLHEIGHIETTKSSMRRVEAEYYATVFAVEQCKKYGVKIPDKTKQAYQDYINMEYDRGKRRGGQNYRESYIIQW